MKIKTYESEPIPAGVYPVTLTNTDTGESQYGPYLKLTFTIVDGEHSGRELTAMSAMSAAGIGTKSKLYKWATALLGREPGDEFDTDDLIGCSALADVSIVPGKEAGSRFNRVEAVFSLPRGAARPQLLPTPSDRSAF